MKRHFREYYLIYMIWAMAITMSGMILCFGRSPDPVVVESYQLVDKHYGPSGTAQRCLEVFRNLATGEVTFGVVYECPAGTPSRPLSELGVVE